MTKPSQPPPLARGRDNHGTVRGERRRPGCAGEAANLEELAETGSEYQVEVRRSFSVTVNVTASSPEGALDRVNRHDFELPARDEWAGHKDWSYTVYDADGSEVLSADR